MFSKEELLTIEDALKIADERYIKLLEEKQTKKQKKKQKGKTIRVVP